MLKKPREYWIFEAGIYVWELKKISHTKYIFDKITQAVVFYLTDYFKWL